jgi:CHAT domain-containing protein
VSEHDAPGPARTWARRLTDDGATGADWTAALAAVTAIELAWALKDECQAAWHEEPPRAQRCAAAASDLARAHAHHEIKAAVAWCEGMALSARGEMDAALARLEAAHAGLAALGQRQRAAQSQIPKVIALTMLGRHDEALACGEATRQALIAAGDELGAGKIELNLGWMLMRRDRYEDAARHFRQSAVRFARTGDVTRSILADVGRASALTWQFEFDEALRLYERSTMRARARKLGSVLGLIDTHRGRLELHRGRHAAALTALGAALREAEADGMPQDVAEARRDLADAYLALNLLPEAIALYDQTIDICRRTDAPIERAWAEVQRALAVGRQGDRRHALQGLENARALFGGDGNTVGSALADLHAAALLLALGDADAALPRAQAAAEALREAGVEGWRWEAELHGADALCEQGRFAEAQACLSQVLDATAALPEPRTAAHISLGRLLRRQGDADGARAQFGQAVRCIEQQRAALAADEFRIAYGADKQEPYDALIELALDESPWRLLRAIEQARAPALRTTLDRPDAADGGGIDAERRERLHWLQGQWQQAMAAGEAEQAAQLQLRARSLEHEWLEQSRRRQAAAGAVGLAPTLPAIVSIADEAALRAAMPDDTALIVYAQVRARLMACVVTAQGLAREVVPAEGLLERIEQLRFQIDSLRFGAPALRAHAAQMLVRCRAHLQALHALVWKPVMRLVASCERVVVVPHRALHYLPFAALHDGASYLLERHEIRLAPSLALWWAAQAAPASSAPRSVAAFGVGGKALPHVAAEVEAVAAAFRARDGGSARVHLDGAATQSALRAALAETDPADVLHLACHGQFRADSPYFSALHLADGPLTVRDAAALPLRSQLVTLSACETGLSKVAPGDELLGLLRGFLIAGAPRVLASQWTVDDASTASLMADFYGAVLAGAPAAAALRQAQRHLLATQPHPYHWAAFALHERG